MLKSMLKKCCAVVLVILVPYCSGMSGTPTFVLGTDENYLQPTMLAVYSIMSSTPGCKRIIVLETDDLYGSEIEERSFRELCNNSKDNTQIFRWNVTVLKNALDPELRLAYEKFRTKMNKTWDFEMVAIRALFSVLFNREVLDRTGYLQGLNLEPGEQFMDHFVWLDSDIVVNKNLLCFYTKFSEAQKLLSRKRIEEMLLKEYGFKKSLEEYIDEELLKGSLNGEKISSEESIRKKILEGLGINEELLEKRINDELSKESFGSEKLQQPVISVELRNISNSYNVLNYSKARTIQEPRTSGGVVAWNLNACRQLLSEKDLTEVLLRFYDKQSGYQDEIFIDTILKFWAHGQFSTDKEFDRYYLSYDGHYVSKTHNEFYVADKFFNILPKDWMHAELVCNFVGFCLNQNNNTRNQVINTWMSMYPTEDASDDYVYSIELLGGFTQKKIARRMQKLQSFLLEIELHNSGINKAEEERILNKLSKNKRGKKGQIATKLFKILNMNEDERQNLLEHYQIIMDNPVVIHWDQCLKPWIKIALVLLHNQQLHNQSEITLKTFLDLLSNNDYYLDIADLMWLNNLVKWLNAEGENGDIELKQCNRIQIAQQWFKSLINSQKHTFDQAIRILISSKEANPNKTYFELAEEIRGKMFDVDGVNERYNCELLRRPKIQEEINQIEAMQEQVSIYKNEDAVVDKKEVEKMFASVGGNLSVNIEILEHRYTNDEQKLQELKEFKNANGQTRVPGGIWDLLWSKALKHSEIVQSNYEERIRKAKDDKVQIYEGISTLTRLQVEIWSDGLKSTTKWLNGFYLWSINDESAPEERRQEVYRWLDSFQIRQQ